MVLLVSVAAVQLAAVGCIGVPHKNPDFPDARSEARAALRVMNDGPVALERPVVVLGGYRGGPRLPRKLIRKLARATSGDTNDFLPVSYVLRSNEAAVVEKILERVESRWPNPGQTDTIEVDVVAISMGGLMARSAALPLEARPPEIVADVPAKRLKINRLFTIGTPHRGAKAAERIAPDELALAMQRGSPLFERLDADLERGEYEIIAYTRLRDGLVGSTRAAPPGQEPIWMSGSVLFTHVNSRNDPRIVADIARQLRGLPSRGEGTPPPRD